MSEEIVAVSALTEQNGKTYSVTHKDYVIKIMTKARDAFSLWEALTVEQRVKKLVKLEAIIQAEMDAIVEVIMTATGKVKTEVLLGEIYPVLTTLRFYQNNAAVILDAEPVTTPVILFPKSTAQIARRPFGVVAVISPWNFPFQLTLIPILTALITGNSVIFKMSELSLPVGDLLIDLLSRSALPENLVQQVIGFAETGQQLIASRPDMVFFTGSLAAGRAVMASAAQHPIPVVLELGGKDAMVVFADANQTRVVNAALYGAFSNSGQVCVSVERCYVEASYYQDFIRQLTEAVLKLKVGHGSSGDLGGLTTLKQFAVIEAHYNDALAKGAKASGALKLEGRYLHPIVLCDVTHDMNIMREETFGPVLPVMKFTSVSEVIELANDTDFGLNASVWSQDIAKAERVAKHLKVGSWAINDVIKNIGHPGLPFGGVKNSGFGRYHGAEGLRSFTYTVAGLTSRSTYESEPNWFPYSDQRYIEMRAFFDVMFGNEFLFLRIKRNWRALQAFKQYSSLNLGQHWHNFKIQFFNKSLRH